MSTHIGAQKGEIAPIVLMPGDPYRAKWAAQTFLDNPVCHNEVRGMLGFTGEYQGLRVSIQGSGMGIPSFAIYTNELIDQYDAKVIMRIGSCGAMADHVEVRDVIMAMTASTDSSFNRNTFAGVDFAPCADWGLLSSAAAIAASRKIRHHIGGIFSSDTFYTHRFDPIPVLREHGALAIEMETLALYTIAARKNVRALAICTVSDHLLTREELKASEREQTFADMVEIALETALVQA